MTRFPLCQGNPYRLTVLTNHTIAFPITYTHALLCIELPSQFLSAHMLHDLTGRWQAGLKLSVLPKHDFAKDTTGACCAFVSASVER
ncbi:MULTISPECIES: hypothetical protein [Nitrosomonas]|uniref:Uncharacterized protein n=1 Tax=Nitrosomonas communis TaxID=44574 RepID=A0A0F7KDU4_9PROT|nr:MULTISPECIES: hypothetical protein [Nitrosomonas]AKH36929.1 hypothetical protein AAW31_02505 [Nitrosomonas communis]UVS62049.1 hypothetical protein NX761_02650 [Nitrosomonas sp. PLL12]